MTSPGYHQSYTQQDVLLPLVPWCQTLAREPKSFCLVCKSIHNHCYMCPLHPQLRVFCSTTNHHSMNPKFFPLYFVASVRIIMKGLYFCCYNYAMEKGYCCKKKNYNYKILFYFFNLILQARNDLFIYLFIF